MKRIITLILSLCMLFTVCTGVSADADKIYLYVKSGAENGDGSIDSPFGAWEDARDYIRQIKKEGKYPSGGVVVYFREGVYNLSESVELTNEDSGTANAPVVYRSYMEEQVTFTGGVKISLEDFTPVADDVKGRLSSDAAKSVKQFDLKSVGIHDYGELGIYGGGRAYYIMQGTNLPEAPTKQSPEFFVGNEAYTLARWPNDGYVLTNKIIQPGTPIEMYTNMNKNMDGYIPPEERKYPPEPTIFTVESDTLKRMKTWQSPENPWIFGYFKVDYTDVSLPVAKIDTEEGIITTKWPSPKTAEAGKRFYFFNILEELDMPGEYYLDRNIGIVYVYPKINKGDVFMSLMETPIVKMKDAHNIRISGISFTGVRGDCVSLTNCRDVVLELCSFSKAAGKGMTWYNCMNCSVISCHIYDTGSGGVNSIKESGFSGEEEYQNNLDTLTPMNNRMENCEVNNFSRITQTYSPAAQFTGVGDVVRNNKFYDSTHMAIGTMGPESLIENNEIFDVCRTGDDSAALYVGYSKINRGITIRNNYFHDIATISDGAAGISAIYADDLFDGLKVYGNVFENIGGRCVWINGGRANEVKNNVAINADSLVRLNPMGTYTSQDDYYGIGKEFTKDSRFKFHLYLDNPAYAKYPHFTDLLEDEWMYPKYNVSENNVIVNCEDDFVLSNPQKITMEKMVADNDFNASAAFSSDPGFVNMKERNYTLKEDSKVYSKLPDFEAPDFMNMGMYTGRAKVMMEGNVAYLSGSPKAYVGFEGKEINADHTKVPFKENEIIYIPLRFTAEALGYQVNWNPATGAVTVSDGAKITEVNAADIKAIDGVSYVTSEWFNTILGLDVAVYDNGLVIVGQEVSISSGDANILNELKRRLNNE